LTDKRTNIQCRILNISQPYRPLRSVTQIILLFIFLCVHICIRRNCGSHRGGYRCYHLLKSAVRLAHVSEASNASAFMTKLCLLIARSTQFLVLMMEEICSSVIFFQITRRHIPEASILPFFLHLDILPTNHSLSLTLWSWALLERQPVVKPLDSFQAFYGTRKFITALTTALHLCLSWARPIQSTSPHPTYPRSILILSTHASWSS
jgi:hypothetical protein